MDKKYLYISFKIKSNYNLYGVDSNTFSVSTTYIDLSKDGGELQNSPPWFFLYRF